MFEMKEEYKIGVQFIDEQHAKLFEIAERAYQLLSNDYIPDKYDGIVTILQELTDYTRMHFADEEAYMESIGYKKMFTQKIDHDAFVRRLEEMDLQKVDDNQEESILNILNYLNDWLVHHILEKDKQIVEA
ncbi:MAG TPA: hemerythrin family protein [Lachnospiraceae bacterium]|nr:hemerythrin family protein [Lachnospiraceae bacterium]